MHIDAVPNRQARPTYLLRESFREGDRVRKRTLANLSALSDEQIATIRRVLRGEALCLAASTFEVVASRARGHVEAVCVAMRKLGVERLLAARPSRERDLVLAMVAARIVAPHTKLATTRWWHTTTLAEDFGVADADEDDLYAAMDWLLARQDAIQKKLAARHLQRWRPGAVRPVVELLRGQHCPLAKLGYNRDGKKGMLQVNYGLLTDRARLPGGGLGARGQRRRQHHLHARRCSELRESFGIEQLVMVGDRGMISSKAIDEMRESDGIGWITALKSASIRALVEQGQLQLGLFDERNLLELELARLSGRAAGGVPQSRSWPSCARTSARSCSRPPRPTWPRSRPGWMRASSPARMRSACASGKVINQYKVAKHFELAIGDDRLHLRAQARRHRRRGGAGRHLHHPHLGAAPRRWTRPTACATTSRWPTSSARSARSRRST